MSWPRGLANLATIRCQELDGFVDGLFGDKATIGLPERAHCGQETLSEMRALMAAVVQMARDEYPFWSRPEFGPFAAISKERICHYDEFSHDRCNGHFAGFACANELIVFCLETGIASRCDQSWHVDGPP
jgi:hypothetical protein